MTTAPLNAQLTGEQIDTLEANIGHWMAYYETAHTGCDLSEIKQLCALAKSALSAEAPVALKLSGYGDDDECFGATINEYVDRKNSMYELDDESRLKPSEEFYVEACWYRTEKWRVITAPTTDNPSAAITCECVSHPVPAAPQAVGERVMKACSKHEGMPFTITATAHTMQTYCPHCEQERVTVAASHEQEPTTRTQCCNDWDSLADSPECATCPNRLHFLRGRQNNIEAGERHQRTVISRPVSEVAIPLTEVLDKPCKGCGKRPIDFISGAASPAAGNQGDARLQWDKPLTSDEAAKYLLTKGFVAAELYDATVRELSTLRSAAGNQDTVAQGETAVNLQAIRDVIYAAHAYATFGSGNPINLRMRLDGAAQSLITLERELSALRSPPSGRR